MTTLTVLPSGKSYEVAAGISLLAALQSVGEPIQSKCGGGAKCEACHVAVPEGRKSLAFSFAFRAADRTLTDSEVNAVLQRIQEGIAAGTPYQVRK